VIRPSEYPATNDHRPFAMSQPQNHEGSSRMITVMLTQNITAKANLIARGRAMVFAAFGESAHVSPNWQHVWLALGLISGRLL
jgi:hypothetical protein